MCDVINFVQIYLISKILIIQIKNAWTELEIMCQICNE